MITLNHINTFSSHLSESTSLCFSVASFSSYFKVADNFVDALVLNAGHMVPTDQPEVALELIDRFIRNDL